MNGWGQAVARDIGRIVMFGAAASLLGLALVGLGAYMVGLRHHPAAPTCPPQPICICSAGQR